MPHTNHARDRFLLPFVALLLVGSVSWAADSPVTLSVRPTVVFAGRDVRATVRTPRDTRNRELRVVIEAADYYASSDVQLDGADAAATHQFNWKELPGGAYRVEATLTREDGGHQTATQCFAVLGLDDSADALQAAAAALGAGRARRHPHRLLRRSRPCALTGRDHAPSARGRRADRPVARRAPAATGRAGRRSGPPPS